MDKNDLFIEFDKHLLEDEAPSVYFNNSNANIFSDIYPFTMLGDLKNTEQQPTHHPEGNVWNHTMMVVDMAAEEKSKSSDEKIFMWAALLHDLGKAPTTRIKKNKIISYDHDKIGETLCIKFLSEFNLDDDFIYKVSKLVRWHMQCLFVAKEMPFADVNKMISETNMDDIALLCYCDRLGRGSMTNEKIELEKGYINKFIKIVKNIEKCKRR